MILKEIFEAELSRVGANIDDMSEKFEVLEAMTNNIGAIHIDIEISEEAIKVAIVLADDKLVVMTSPFDDFYPVGIGQVIYSFFVDGVNVFTHTSDVDGFKNNFEKYMRNIG